MAALLVAPAGCGGDGKGSVSSNQVQRDAEVVLRADLRPGSTEETAARIVRRLVDFDGVAGTRGDSGEHVWIYSTTDVTAAQITTIRKGPNGISSVSSVRQPP